MKLHRSDYPALHRLMDEIANQLNAPKVDRLVANSEFNAFITRTGMRRKSVVGIGIPLFSVLNLQEKISVLAHEMGHHANADLTRRFIVRQALRTLGLWYGFLFPKTDYLEIIGPFHYVIAFIRKRLADVVYYAYLLLGLSVWKQSQRAEYFADMTSARIAGTEAAVSALGKMHFAPTFFMTLKKVAHYRYSNELFEEVRKFTRSIPEKEERRLNKIRESAPASLDDTHPPTLYRIRHLNRQPVGSFGLSMDESFCEQLNQEFAQLEKATERRLLDDYRAWYIE
ncbi:M48 family metallopeptidase [Cohnella faecalis]|nr:M48 family metallopeptidase [Cohnella faecalis]